MRLETGQIPRAFKNHRNPKGYAYRTYLEGILTRLGPLPADARPTLREAGRLTVDLEAMGFELDTARELHRRRDVARLRRQMASARAQLMKLERRLEEFANHGSHARRDPLADVRRAVEEANRPQRTSASTRPIKAAGGRR